MIIESYKIKDMVIQELPNHINGLIKVLEMKTNELRAEEVPHIPNDVIKWCGGSQTITDVEVLKTLKDFAVSNDIELLGSNPLQLLALYNSKYEQRQRDIYANELVVRKLRDRLNNYAPQTAQRTGKDILLDAFVFDNLTSKEDKEETLLHEIDKAVNDWFNGVFDIKCEADRMAEIKAREIDIQEIKNVMADMLVNRL